MTALCIGKLFLRIVWYNLFPAVTNAVVMAGFGPDPSMFRRWTRYYASYGFDCKSTGNWPIFFFFFCLLRQQNLRVGALLTTFGKLIAGGFFFSLSGEPSRCLLYPGKVFSSDKPGLCAARIGLGLSERKLASEAFNIYIIVWVNGGRDTCGFIWSFV